MPKLSKDFQFFDLSDYGRSPARWLAKNLKYSPITPVHITILFGIVGLCAIYCVLEESFWPAFFLLILKSILDAADGELSRVRNKPSYIGRYLDSIFDIAINLLLVWSIWEITTVPLYWAIGAFLGIQLQGTLYNYYYVILRNIVKGDRTSRIFESSPPHAFADENQKVVNVLFSIYKLLYGIFDKTIHWMDRKATLSEFYPSWFMSSLSIFGLGAQLLIIGLMLVAGLKEYILIFFTCFTILILLFVFLRKYYLKAPEYISDI